MRVPIDLPPGIYRRGTEYQSKGRWWDADLTRWYGQQLGPIGGWRKRSTSPISGKARQIITWKTSVAAPVRWIAAGSHTHLEVQSAAGTVSDITPAAFVAGAADETIANGYGVGNYGADTYGTPRQDVSATITDALVWDLDVFGDKLRACAPSDGRILKWDGNTANVTTAVSGAPTGCLGLVVTDNRFLFALGPGGLPRRLQWSDQADDTDWTPSSTNQSGSLDLETFGTLRKAVRLGAAILVFTDVDVHLGTYVGLPEVWRFQKIGTGCGLLARGAVVGMGQQAAWWSKSGFWTYDGALRPVECDVYEHLISDVNPGQRSKITGLHNSRFGEVWFFHPSSASNEIAAYVYWDYRRNHWGIGVSLARLCAVQEGVFTSPLAIDASGYIYEHEVGFAQDGATPFAETGPVELGEGERVMGCDTLISDDVTPGDVSVTFKGRLYPDSAETSYGPYSITSAGPTDVRFQARQAKLRISQVNATDWRFGKCRLDVSPRGRR